MLLLARTHSQRSQHAGIEHVPHTGTKPTGFGGAQQEGEQLPGHRDEHGSDSNEGTQKQGTGPGWGELLTHNPNISEGSQGAEGPNSLLQIPLMASLWQLVSPLATGEQHCTPQVTERKIYATA